MDLLSIGLLLGSSIAIIGSVDIVKSKFSKTLRIWYRLGLNKYKISRKYRTAVGYGLIIKVPIGGSLSELESYKGKIEKAYGCTCEIEDLKKTKYLAIELTFKNEPNLITN